MMLASSMKLLIGFASYWMHIITMSSSPVLRNARTPAGETRMILPSPTSFSLRQPHIRLCPKWWCRVLREFCVNEGMQDFRQQPNAVPKPRHQSSQVLHLKNLTFHIVPTIQILIAKLAIIVNNLKFYILFFTWCKITINLIIRQVGTFLCFGYQKVSNADFKRLRHTI